MEILLCTHFKCDDDDAIKKKLDVCIFNRVHPWKGHDNNKICRWRMTCALGNLNYRTDTETGDEIFAFASLLSHFFSLLGRSMNQQDILMHSIHPRVTVCNKLNFCGHWKLQKSSIILFTIISLTIISSRTTDLPDCCSPVDGISLKKLFLSERRWRHSFMRW